jgi:hypothetical protein
MGAMGVADAVVDCMRSKERLAEATMRRATAARASDGRRLGEGAAAEERAAARASEIAR